MRRIVELTMMISRGTRKLIRGKMCLGKKRAVSTRRIAEILIERRPGGFTSDFENNKIQVSEMMQFPSKATRNMVAGYITRTTQHPSSEEVQPKDEEDTDE